jgi:transcriptional regulator NrdR family protein
MPPDDPINESSEEESSNGNSAAQPYACEDCNARFSTLSKKKFAIPLMIRLNTPC